MKLLLDENLSDTIVPQIFFQARRTSRPSACSEPTTQSFGPSRSSTTLPSSRRTPTSNNAVSYSGRTEVHFSARRQLPDQPHYRTFTVGVCPHGGVHQRSARERSGSLSNDSSLTVWWSECLHVNGATFSGRQFCAPFWDRASARALDGTCFIGGRRWLLALSPRERSYPAS